MQEFREPAITISGQPLTVGQAMTMRVALEHFMMTLSSEGLGKDEMGQSICDGYLRCIQEIRSIPGFYPK